MSRGQAWKAVAVPITVPSGRLPATESVVLTPKSKAKHHDHVLQATMSKVQSNSNVGTDHPNIRMPCLRSHLSARGRAGRSDGIQRNRWLVPGRIASANVRPPQLGPPFAESTEAAGVGSGRRLRECGPIAFAESAPRF
jgi:hypothetical protein